MLFGALRRVLSLVGAFLVAYAFVTVPIGRRTGYEHLRAILSTEPAREAVEDVRHAGTELGHKLLGGDPQAPGSAQLSAHPAASSRHAGR